MTITQLMKAVFVLVTLLSAAYFIGYTSLHRQVVHKYRFICYNGGKKAFDGIVVQGKFSLQDGQMIVCHGSGESCMNGQSIKVDSCVYNSVEDGHPAGQATPLRLTQEGRERN